MERKENHLHIGDEVLWCGGFGKDVAKKATIKFIDLSDRKDYKEGQSLESIHWDLIKDGWCVVSLTNGHWAYGEQISPLKNELQTTL